MMPKSICLFSVLLLLTACSGVKDKMLIQIETAEAALQSDSSMIPDVNRANEVIKLYVEFADKLPDDSLSADYLFKAADISSKVNETAQAIQLFQKFRDTYPEHPNAPFALFLQGFVYENQIGDPAKAKPYYEQFLEQYPNHILAKDAEFSLKNLGKSPEELIREMEMMQADTVAMN